MVHLLLLLHHHPPRLKVLLLLVSVSIPLAVLLIPDHHPEVVLGQVLSPFNNDSSTHESRPLILRPLFAIAIGRLIQSSLHLSFIALPLELLPPLMNPGLSSS